VIIVCDDIFEGNRALRQLRAETECQNKNLHLMECDLCSLDSVRRFAELYNTEEERLDVLICNASLVWSSNIVTIDGYNSVVQANYLGHFLLTNLLLDKLKQCRPSRIINVSSYAHKSSKENHFKLFNLFLYLAVRTIDWSDALTQFNNDRLWGAYSTSKVFQILSAYKLKHDLLSSRFN
jgi:NAD(P)-dependent dehydrogenase (short-subunit alcohol dehydrogenase family)